MSKQVLEATMNISILHKIGGLFVFFLISLFWFSSNISEVFFNQNSVVFIKHLIAKYGLISIVATMSITGISGNLIAKKRKGQLVEKKKKRMKILAFIGVFVMIPAALYLDYKAINSEFDNWFYSVQAVEFLFGFGQLIILGNNFRDGKKLTGRLRSH